MLEVNPLVKALTSSDSLNDKQIIQDLISEIEAGKTHPWHLYYKGDPHRFLSHNTFAALGKVLNRLDMTNQCFRVMQKNLRLEEKVQMEVATVEAQKKNGGLALCPPGFEPRSGGGSDHGKRKVMEEGPHVVVCGLPTVPKPLGIEIVEKKKKKKKLEMGGGLVLGKLVVVKEEPDEDKGRGARGLARQDTDSSLEMLNWKPRIASGSNCSRKT